MITVKSGLDVCLLDASQVDFSWPSSDVIQMTQDIDYMLCNQSNPHIYIFMFAVAVVRDLQTLNKHSMREEEQHSWLALRFMLQAWHLQQSYSSSVLQHVHWPHVTPCHRLTSSLMWQPVRSHSGWETWKAKQRQKVLYRRGRRYWSSML